MRRCDGIVSVDATCETGWLGLGCGLFFISSAFILCGVSRVFTLIDSFRI